jgi:hypothetical protein
VIQIDINITPGVFKRMLREFLFDLIRLYFLYPLQNFNCDEIVTLSLTMTKVKFLFLLSCNTSKKTASYCYITDKTMKSIPKILLAATLLCGSAYTYAKPVPVVKISASEIVDRHLSGFNAINVAGPFDVQLTQGAVESVKVEAPADVIDKILTDVSGGVLKVYSKHDTFSWGNWFGNHKKIMVYVVVKDLNAISLTGSGDISFKEGIKGGALRFKISGSGDMVGRVDARTIETSITGSGDVRLSGSAESTTVSVVGSGDYSARDLTTKSTAVRVSGSGDAYINASEKVDAAVNGSGDIHYSGGPKNVSKSKSGSGDISGH